MNDDYAALRWLITLVGALAGLVGFGVAVGQHRQRLEDHDRRLSEVEQDLHTMAASSRLNDVAVARLEATMQAVVNALDRIEKKLDRGGG